MCEIIFTYDAIGVPGTPSSGNNQFGLTYSIGVPNGDFVGEWIPDGVGFGPCPTIAQYIVRARNPRTGEIIGQVPTNTCHDLQLKGWINTCDTPQTYDCINGVCTPSDTYSTPGIYNSLSECEINCGLQGCSGVCISNADWATIQGLSNQLKNKNCS